MVTSLVALSVLPLTAVGVIAPWVGGAASVLMSGRGERQAGRVAGVGAVFLLAWVPMLIASGALATLLDQPAIGIGGAAVALACCVTGSTLLARSAGIHESGHADPRLPMQYLLGTALSCAAMAGLAGLAFQARGTQGDLFGILFLGACAAAVLGPAWISGAGAGMALVRAVKLPRLDSEDWAEPR